MQDENGQRPKRFWSARISPGVPLKNAVVAHLEKNGWEVTDIGVKSVDEENPEMFHRIGLKVGAKSRRENSKRP